MFRFVEHQADIAVELEADSREGLFISALEAITAILTGDPERYSAPSVVDIKLNHLLGDTSIKSTGFDDEELLVGLMNEFLYLCQVEGFYPLKVNSLTFNRENSIIADLSGLSGEHGLQLEREIKAATYHDLHITSDKTWRVKVVMDV